MSICMQKVHLPAGKLHDIESTSLERYTCIMGERNSTTGAIILTVQEQGENNRSVCAFSAELGIFYATLYGGAKSKMRALVQPFNSGKLWLYTDENKHQCKISDFDVTNCHLSLRTSLYKMWAANLAAEIILKTRGAGDDAASFRLLSAYIDGIDSCDEEGARLGTIRFLWRYLGLLGVQPDVHLCTQCGRSLLSGVVEHDNSALPGKAHASYRSGTNGFVCADCLPYSEEKTGYDIDLDGLTYLASINELSPGQVRGLSISSSTAHEIKTLVFALIESACGSKLKSLESGLGIL